MRWLMLLLLRKIFTLSKILITLPLSIIYFISGFVKKNYNLWIFGSYHNKFCDNSKYFFKYIIENQKHIKAYWMTSDKHVYNSLKKKGFNVIKKYSVKGFILGARAKIVIISSYRNNVNPYVIKNAFIVNLWHGIPLKKIEYDIPPKFNNNFFLKMKIFEKLSYLFPYFKYDYDLLIASSEKIKAIIMSAFKVPQKKIMVTGEPRNDVLFNKSRNTLKIKNILYLPTFRTNENFDYFNYHFNPQKWEEMLKRKDYYLYIKLHPNHAYREKKYTDYFHNYTRIEFFTNKTDVYDLLQQTDVLVTDYSSVMFDFVVTNKPIIFLSLDYQEYLQKERPLYFDYKKITGDNIYYDWESLRVYFEKEFNQGTIKNSKLLNNLVLYKDNLASKRVYKSITHILNKK